MTWTLAKSRNLYFKETGDDSRVSAWSAETDLLATAGFGFQTDEVLLSWDPSAKGARANCPVLHNVLESMSAAVGPMWRARVANLYAGRTRNAGVPTAMSDKNPKGGMVALGFDYTYCLLGAVITWAHFLHDTDAIRAQPGLGANADAMRAGALAAFAQIRERGVDGIKASRIFEVSSEAESRSSAEIQERAEVWVLAHEVAHHILRHGSSRPDAEAAATVQRHTSDAGVLVETAGMSREQKAEIDADVLAYLLTCGEYADRRHPRLEMVSASGALLALVAVGLLDNDWTAEPEDTHPGTLTRMAVIARIAARRILEDDACAAAEGEDLVRTLASILAYAAWISNVSIAPGSREHHAANVIGDFVHASTRLMIGWEERLFGSPGADDSRDVDAT